MPDVRKVPEVDESHAAIEGFDHLLYWLSAKTDTFDMAGFRAAVPPNQSKRERGSLTFAPRDPERGQYHVYVGWTARDERIEFEIQYYSGSIGHAADEREPYAEQVMQWLGDFFTVPVVTVHAHLRFRFDSKRRRIGFPLRLATAPPCDAEVTGVALRLPTKPHGASNVRLTASGRSVYAEVIRQGKIEFKSHSLNADLNAAAAVLQNFLKEGHHEIGSGNEPERMDA